MRCFVNQTEQDEPHAKKPKAGKLSGFEEWPQAEKHCPSNTELERCVDSGYSCVDIGDLLEWWKSHAEKYPMLSQIIRIPVTSASSKRNFSSAGLVLQQQRTRLSPECVDTILFLHANV